LSIKRTILTVRLHTAFKELPDLEFVHVYSSCEYMSATFVLTHGYPSLMCRRGTSNRNAMLCVSSHQTLW